MRSTADLAAAFELLERDADAALTDRASTEPTTRASRSIGARTRTTLTAVSAAAVVLGAVAIGLAKQALNYGQHAALNQSMTQELFNLELSCRTGDFKEGLEAFRQRRAPKFNGR